MLIQMRHTILIVIFLIGILGIYIILIETELVGKLIMKAW